MWPRRKRSSGQAVCAQGWGTGGVDPTPEYAIVASKCEARRRRVDTVVPWSDTARSLSSAGRAPARSPPRPSARVCRDRRRPGRTRSEPSRGLRRQRGGRTAARGLRGRHATFRSHPSRRPSSRRRGCRSSYHRALGGSAPHCQVPERCRSDGSSHSVRSPWRQTRSLAPAPSIRQLSSRATGLGERYGATQWSLIRSCRPRRSRPAAPVPRPTTRRGADPRATRGGRCRWRLAIRRERRMA
jgi:hypothetical protein